MTVYKISLYNAFGDINIHNTPDNRKRPAADLFKLLDLTPEDHKFDKEFATIGEFFDKGGAIERLIKKERRQHNDSCASCKPLLRDVKSLPEWHGLVDSIPPTPEIPEYKFLSEKSKTTLLATENDSPSPLSRKRKDPPTDTSDLSDLVKKMNDHMRDVLKEVKTRQKTWSDEVQSTIRKDVEKLYDAMPWSVNKSAEHFPRSQRCFAEYILRSWDYPGRALVEFLKTKQRDEASFIHKIYNPEIHRMVHSAAAADVAEAMLANRSGFTEGEWEFASRMFKRHTNFDMEKAVQAGLGIDETTESHRFGGSFHYGDPNRPLSTYGRGLFTPRPFSGYDDRPSSRYPSDSYRPSSRYPNDYRPSSRYPDDRSYSRYPKNRQYTSNHNGSYTSNGSRPSTAGKSGTPNSNGTSGKYHKGHY